MRRTFAKLEDAKTEAEQIVKKLESGHRTAARMRNADAEEWGLAKADLEPLKIPLNVAVKEFAEAKRILDGKSIIEAARFYAERRPTQNTTISGMTPSRNSSSRNPPMAWAIATSKTLARDFGGSARRSQCRSQVSRPH